MNWLGGPQREPIIGLDLQSFLMKLGNLRQLTPMSENVARYFRQFSEIRSLLYNSPQTRYSVESLAAEVNLSKSYFQHVYKENKSVCNNHIRACIHQKMICAILCFVCIDPEMSLIHPVFPMKNPLRFATIKSIFSRCLFYVVDREGIMPGGKPFSFFKRFVL